MTNYDETETGTLIYGSPVSSVGEMVVELLQELLIPTVEYTAFASLVFMVGWLAFKALRYAG